MKALVAGIAAFVSDAKVCHPTKRLDISRDPEDNMVLECCHASVADVLVTGDRDLLDIPRGDLRGSGLQKLRVFRPIDYLG